MKEYNYDNINKFFEDLMNCPNAKFHMMRVYNAYKNECDVDEKKQEIEKIYENTANHCNVYIINNDIAIIELEEYSNIIGYFAHVRNKKAYYVWNTFEAAFLCAVSIVLTGSGDATEWMLKLVKG